MRKVSRRGVAAGRAKGKSLCAELAPSSGAQGSNGIQRRKRRPRMDKQEREFRLRGTGNRVKEGGEMMRFAGIDIGAERHMVAVLDALRSSASYWYLVTLPRRSVWLVRLPAAS